MNFVIILILFFVIFIADCLDAKLIVEGNHTCLVPETFQQNTVVGRDVRKPKTEISFCWDPSRFFRCSKTTYVTERIYENKPVTRTRFLAKCCPGYIKSPLDNSSCVPFCWPICHNGNCTAPDTCTCFPGYYGATCLQQCPSDSWGHYCSEKCQCKNEAKCDSATGDCLCKPGWRGSRCESICEDGYYGIGCQQKCNCSDQLCNFQTGTCVSTTTETVDSTVFTFTQNSNFEVFEKPTISIAMTTMMTLPVKDDSLTNLNKNTSEEKATTTTTTTRTTTANLINEKVTFVNSITLKNREESSTVVVNDVKEENFFNNKISETQLKKIEEQFTSTILTTSTSEVTEKAETTKEIFLVEETTHEVKIFKNVDSYTETNNVTDVVKSGNKTNENNFLYKNKKNNTNEIDKNGLIENATLGEYFKNFSKEIENEINVNKNYASEREKNLYAFQFMPSLIVLFGVLIVITIIGAGWLITNRRKRKQKIEKVKEDKLYNSANLKFTESVYTVNNFFEDPIHMSDMNLNVKEPPPVLLTFKPIGT